VNPNKTDAHLRRHVVYDVAVDPATGAVEATATVTLHNDAPPGPVPGLTESIQAVLGNGNGDPLGTNRMQVAVFSPLDLIGARLGGAPTPVETQSEFGGRVYGFAVVLPPGGRAVLELDLAGTLEPGPYQLAVSQPGLARPDRVDVTVASVGDPFEEADGLDLRSGVATRSGPMPEDLRVEVR
jgi:hypothetical protein